MGLCFRPISRLRFRRVHLVFCGIVFCAIYIVLYQDIGITLPALELNEKGFEPPLRFRIAEGWAWRDDIDYSRTTVEKSISTMHEKQRINVTKEDLLLSVAQDPGLDYGQGRYLELEGVDDYVMWHDGPEPTKKEINRKIRSCKKPIQNVLLLKTHFTGSDVITNILNRFADLRGLRIALPSGGLSTFYWPSRFQWKYVDIMLLDGALPNILCNHARFNGDVMDEIMPPRTAFITIVRDPMSHFEVTFRNLEFAEVLEMEGVTHPHMVFLENPGKYITRAIQHKRFKDSLNLIKNGMFFDLGLRTTDYHKPEVVKDAIIDIDDKFTLVLIYEYLDESLVLMKRKLCWQLDDVLYLKFHYQRHGEPSLNEMMSSGFVDKIQRWNKADFMLYHYFNDTLWKEIHFEGKDFIDELRDFRSKHEEMERDCLGVGSVNVEKITLNPNVSSYNRYLCEKMLFNDIEYIHYFRKKMENVKMTAPANSTADGNKNRIHSGHAQERNEVQLNRNETEASVVSTR